MQVANYYQLKDFCGKDRGLKFNQAALEVFAKNINWEAPVNSSIYAIFFAGLTGNAIVKREEMDISFEEVVDAVDKMYEDKRNDEIKAICDMWTETNVYKEWFSEVTEKIRLLQPQPETKGEKSTKKKTSTMSG